MPQELRLPQMIGHENYEQFQQQIKAFLYQTVEQLNRSLDAIENDAKERIREATAKLEEKTPQKSIDNFNDIKTLIIRSGDILKAYAEKMQKFFVAVDDFEEYTIEVADVLGPLAAHVKAGNLGSEESPEYGVEIGVLKGTEFEKLLKVTDERISIFQSDSEVFCVSGDKIYINGTVFGGGLYGLGECPAIQKDEDVNEIRTPGRYSVRTVTDAVTIKNLPDQSGPGTLTVFSADGSGASAYTGSAVYLLQQYAPAGNNITYERTANCSGLDENGKEIWVFGEWFPIATDLSAMTKKSETSENEWNLTEYTDGRIVAEYKGTLITMISDPLGAVFALTRTRTAPTSMTVERAEITLLNENAFRNAVITNVTEDITYVIYSFQAEDTVKDSKITIRLEGKKKE